MSVLLDRGRKCKRDLSGKYMADSRNNPCSKVSSSVCNRCLLDSV